MRYYNSKNVERQYVVVKHQLPGIDTTLLGVRYREGYGVVAKNSKEYDNLKRIKMAVVAEFPLTFLKTLKCIISDAQVKAIWGSAIYAAYRKEITKALKQIEETNESVIIEEIVKHKCEGTTAAGSQCKNDAVDGSIFCKKHIHFDTRIAAKLIEAGNIDKSLRKKLIDGWILELE
jgi:hypothetical protein